MHCLTASAVVLLWQEYGIALGVAHHANDEACLRHSVLPGEAEIGGMPYSAYDVPAWDKNRREKQTKSNRRGAEDAEKNKQNQTKTNRRGTEKSKARTAISAKSVSFLLSLRLCGGFFRLCSCSAVLAFAFLCALCASAVNPLAVLCVLCVSAVDSFVFALALQFSLLLFFAPFASLR